MHRGKDVVFFLTCLSLVGLTGNSHENGVAGLLPSIAREDLPCVAAEIRVAQVQERFDLTPAQADSLRYPPVVSVGFDSLWFLSPGFQAYDSAAGREFAAIRERYRDRHYPTPTEGVGLFLLRDIPAQLLELRGGELLSVFSDNLGFESIPHVLLLWQVQGDSLELKGILDHSISVGIGGLLLDDAVELASNAYLLRGTTSGGDGGGVWGSVWFAHWQRPLKLNVIYQKHWEKPDSEDELEVIMDCEFNPKTLVAIISVRQRGSGRARLTNHARQWVRADSLLVRSAPKSWMTVDSDTVRLEDLLARK